MEAQHHQVTEADPEDPHREDADGHGEGSVTGRAENIGQGKAGWPDEDREDIEPDHDLQRHRLRFGREVEEGDGEPVAEQERRDVHDPCAAVGHKQQAACVVDSLLLFTGTETLSDDGQHRHADRIGRDVQEGRGRVSDGVCGDGRSAEGACQAGDGQLADLEHAVLNTGRDAYA